jgi:glyoxylase-like metal-dependent hydrolase (beta-lactamase superfamily II)
VTALNEGVVRNATPANLAVNKTLPDIQKALGDAFLPTDHTINQFNVVIVNTGRNLVLIDTGFGDNGAPTTGNLLSNMTAAGIDPKNVDTILISHFHGDHINGIRAKAGSLNFPNAEIMVPATDLKFFLDAGEESKAPQSFKGFFAASKRVFEPIAKDVKQFEYGKELVPGITTVDARGHSPGHTAFLVTSGNGKLLVSCDTVNHQILVRNPDWALWADMDQAMAAASRKRLLDMAAADKIQIAAYHLPFPSTGFISKRGDGYEFHPAYWQPVW